MDVAGHAIETPLFLSPMVDVTDAAFRSLARDWGADVTCSEMVGAAGLVHGNQGSWRMVQPWPEEAPYGVQLMGGDADQMAEAVRQVAAMDAPPDFIDLNLGCPSPKILKACAGAFLTRDPALAGTVVGAAADAAEEVGAGPVSVKMRLGHDDAHRTYLEVGQAVQDAGAAWVTLHGRTVVQGYGGKADWDAIGKLVEHLDVPVIGNGDVTGPETAVAMRDQTACAGIFIGRAAMHDPTCFERLRAALDGRPAGDGPDMDVRLDALATYLERARAIGITHVGDLRRQATRFVQGAPGAKKLRVAFNQAPDLEALLALVEATRSSSG
ncbi:MAG: tRNA dihydrouridine synthase [Thermoplasmatota archaeon]